MERTRSLVGNMAQLPNKKAYLREAETVIKERYGVTSCADVGELRRIKAALYRGDSERPCKREEPKRKG